MKYKVCKQKDEVIEVLGPSGPQWNNRCVWKPVSESEADAWIRTEAARLMPKSEPRMNTAEETGPRNNAVALDPMRLRSAYLDGAPNTTLRDLFAHPEDHVREWETLRYVFTGVRVYHNETEKAISELVSRMSTE